MPSRVCSLIVAAVLLVPASPAFAVLIDGPGDFVDLVAELRSQVYQSGSNQYVGPTMQQRTDFGALVAGVYNAQTTTDLQNLVPAADALGYDVVRLNDGGVVYHGLRSQVVANVQTRGWGSYFFRQGEFRDAMVQVPHPLFDSNTPEVGARAFEQSSSRTFMMAGAHRNANGPGTADVADPINSIFDVVHEAIADPNAFTGTATVGWQLHGFNIDNWGMFPANADAVVSAGTGGVSPQVIAMDAAIDALGPDWTSYSFNTLPALDPLNVTTNGLIDGFTFNGLGGTLNEQQQFSTAVNVPFVHIELEQTFRLEGPANRQLAADAVAAAIIDQTALIPEPATVGLLIVGAVALVRRRRG